MHLRLLTITSLIAGIGLAVSAIAQPAVPTKEMVVTPFEQVKFSYRSDKAAWESDCCGRKGPGQPPFLDVFEVQERRQPNARPFVRLSASGIARNNEALE